MRDKAYKRDLRRALEQIAKVKSMEVMKSSHIRIVMELPDGTETELTSSGSPGDHQHSINATIRTLKKRMKGIY